jgi:hypothetical protein
MYIKIVVYCFLNASKPLWKSLSLRRVSDAHNSNGNNLVIGLFVNLVFVRRVTDLTFPSFPMCRSSTFPSFQIRHGFVQYRPL